MSDTPMNDNHGFDEEQASTAVEETGSAAEATTQDGSSPSVEEQLAAAKKQAQEYLDGWQRARAEFVNYKKRADRELRESYQNGAQAVLVELLPIVDDFERAMANIPGDLKEHPWLVEGITMIHRKLLRLLEEHNVKAFDPVGEAFDPNRHQAVSQEDRPDTPSGQVLETLQKGYVSGERVLRPAMVKVAR